MFMYCLKKRRVWSNVVWFWPTLKFRRIHVRTVHNWRVLCKPNVSIMQMRINRSRPWHRSCQWPLIKNQDYLLWIWLFNFPNMQYIELLILDIISDLLSDGQTKIVIELFNVLRVFYKEWLGMNFMNKTNQSYVGYSPYIHINNTNTTSFLD